METQKREEKLIGLTKDELTAIEFKAFKEGVNAGDNAVRAAIRLAKETLSEKKESSNSDTKSEEQHPNLPLPVKKGISKQPVKKESPHSDPNKAA